MFNKLINYLINHNYKYNFIRCKDDNTYYFTFEFKNNLKFYIEFKLIYFNNMFDFSIQYNFYQYKMNNTSLPIFLDFYTSIEIQIEILKFLKNHD